MDGGGAAAVEVARRVAEEVLFPAAIAVDRADAVPVAHLDALAEAGLYGVAGPVEAGGADLDLPAFCSVVEALAGGCLTTAFVWVQHHGLVRELAGEGAPAQLRERWLAPLCRGELRAGVALAGLLPGAPRLRARPAEGGWVLDGTSPWVTGWGRIDLLHVVARGPGDTVVGLALDAAERPGLVARRRPLVAVDASATVEVEFASLAVDGGRLLSVQPYHPPDSVATVRVHASLVLGVVARCCWLVGPSGLDGRLADCRRALDEALADGTGERMATARAAVSELAVRASAAAVVSAGSRSIRLDQHAQRLAREASFLLVFGSRPRIRAAMLDQLAGPG